MRIVAASTAPRRSGGRGSAGVAATHDGAGSQVPGAGGGGVAAGGAVEGGAAGGSRARRLDRRDGPEPRHQHARRQPEQPGRAPRDHRDHERAPDDLGEVDVGLPREGVRGVAGEDGVGGGEQDHEHRDDRHRDQQPARDRRGARQPGADPRRDTVLGDARALVPAPREDAPRPDDRGGERSGGDLQHLRHQPARDRGRPRGSDRARRQGLASSRSTVTSQSSARIAANPARPSATGPSHASAGSMRRSPSRPATTSAAAEDRHDDQRRVDADGVAGHEDVDEDPEREREQQDPGRTGTACSASERVRWAPAGAGTGGGRGVWRRGTRRRPASRPGT